MTPAAGVGVLCGAVLLALGVAAVVSAPSAYSPPPALQQVQDEISLTDAFREDAAVSYERWAGSREDHQALNVVQAYRGTPVYLKCLRRAGVEQRWESSINLAGWVSPFAETFWLDPPGVRFVSDSARDAALSWGINVRTPMTGDQAADTADCLDMHIDASPKVHLPKLVPPKDRALRRQWRAAMDTATAGVGDEAAYDACLRSGLPVTTYAVEGPDGDTITQPAFIWFDDYEFGPAAPTYSKVPVYGHGSSPEWEALLAREGRFLVVDWDCRGHEYAQAAARMAPLIVAFDHRNAVAIARRAAYWRQVRTQARRVGWAPDRPFAGLTNHPVR